MNKIERNKETVFFNENVEFDVRWLRDVMRRRNDVECSEYLLLVSDFNSFNFGVIKDNTGDKIGWIRTIIV